MLEQEYIDIAVEEGYTADEARFLWDGKPYGLEPDPAAVRYACREGLPEMKLLRQYPEHEARMAEYSGGND